MNTCIRCLKTSKLKKLFMSMNKIGIEATSKNFCKLFSGALAIDTSESSEMLLKSSFARFPSLFLRAVKCFTAIIGFFFSLVLFMIPVREGQLDRNYGHNKERIKVNVYVSDI